MNKTLSKYFFYYPVTLAKGERVYKYLSKYRRFQWLRTEEIKAYQIARFKKILEYALSQSPFYSELYKRYGIDHREIKTFNDIDKIPAISKSALIENFSKISTKLKYISGTKTTGGSTGQPVQVKKNPGALARERAATWRSYEWAGVGVGDRQARFWGNPHSTGGRIKASLADLASNRFRISAFDLTDSALFSYYHKLVSFRPVYLYGYVSAIKKFTEFIRDKNLRRIPSLKCIITTSELLTDIAAQEMQAVMGCKVFNEYGCGEVGSVAHQCEHGNLHIMAENLLVEVVENEHSHGEILVTDFFNFATPLIRYRVGDCGILGDSLCPCGRGLPLIKSVSGRAYDLIKTPRGKIIHPEAAIYIFESLQAETGAFNQFQLVQASVDKILIRIVPTEKWSEKLVARLKQDFKVYIDDQIDYEIEVCSDIKKEKSGKIRLVKSMSPSY